MKTLPSTSVIVAPRASAATTGKVIASGEATLAARRSSTPRDRGPGTEVVRRMVRTTAMAPRLAHLRGRLYGCIRAFQLRFGRRAGDVFASLRAFDPRLDTR